MYHWVVGHFSAKSAKDPLLIETYHACNLINPRQILTVGGEYMQVLRKNCFIKKYAFLRKLSMLQKCIIGWWCIISRWMTVIKFHHLERQVIIFDLDFRVSSFQGGLFL